MDYRFRRFVFPFGPIGFGFFFGTRRWFGPPFHPYRREEYRRWLEEYLHDLREYQRGLRQEVEEVEREIREVEEEIARLRGEGG